MDNNYIYIERTTNLPGFLSSGLVYDMAIYILRIIDGDVNAKQKIIENKVPGENINIGELKTILQKDRDKIHDIMTAFNETKLSDGPEGETRSVTFQDYPKVKLTRAFYLFLLPVHYVFLNFLEDQGYVSNRLKTDIRKIYNVLNQMVANPNLISEEDDTLNGLIELELGKELTPDENTLIGKKKTKKETPKQETQRQKTETLKARISTKAITFVDADVVKADPVPVFKIIKMLFDRRLHPEITNDIKIIRKKYFDAIKMNNGAAQAIKKIKSKEDITSGEISINPTIDKIYEIDKNLKRNVKEPINIRIKDLIEDINGKQKIKKDIINVYSENLKLFLDFINKNVAFKKELQDLSVKSIEAFNKDVELFNQRLEKYNNESLNDPLKKELYTNILKYFYNLSMELLKVESNKLEIDLSSDKDYNDIEEELDEKIKMPSIIRINRYGHQDRDANFKLPSFIDTFLKKHMNPSSEIKKKFYLQSKEDLQELFKRYAEQFGANILGAYIQVETFGNTKIINKIMNRIDSEVSSGRFPEIAEYSDPYDYTPSLRKLRFFIDTVDSDLKSLDNEIVKIKLIDFIKENEEDVTEYILKLHKRDEKALRDINSKDIAKFFKSIYKSSTKEELKTNINLFLNLIEKTIKSYRTTTEKNPIEYFKTNPDTGKPRRKFWSTRYKSFQWFDVDNPIIDEKEKNIDVLKKQIEDDKVEHYFSKGELNLIQAILNTRGKTIGGLSASDEEEIYLDFITFVRALVNGELELTENEFVTDFSKLSLDELQSILLRYRKNIQKMHNQYYSTVRSATAKQAVPVKANKRLRQKLAGEKPISSADVRKLNKKIKQLSKYDEISRSQELDQLLTDYFRADYIKNNYVKDNKLDKEAERKETLKSFDEWIRIIKIKTSFNSVNPYIIEKPKSDAEIKKFLEEKFRNKFVSDKDIKLAKSILIENSGKYINFKIFRREFLEARRKKMEDIGNRPKTDPGINLIDLPGEEKDGMIIPNYTDKNVTYFLKRYFPAFKNIKLAKEVFNLNDPAEKINEGKIDADFFEAAYKYLYDLKYSEEIDLDFEDLPDETKNEIISADITKIKKSVKEMIGSKIIAPRSTNKYSNLLYLQPTDLSKEIKFSEHATPISMLLSPKTGNNDIGTYSIFVTKFGLEDFISKNQYILDHKLENQLKDMKISISENININSDEDILIFTGEYETLFEPYKSSTGEEISSADIEKYLSIAGKMGRAASRMDPLAIEIQLAPSKKEVKKAISRVDLMSAKAQKRIARLQRRAGKQEVDRVVTEDDDFSLAALNLEKIFDSLFDTMTGTLKRNKLSKKDLTQFEAKVNGKIDDYSSTVQKYRKEFNLVLGDKKLDKIKENIMEQANDIVYQFFIFFDTYINTFFRTLLGLIKKQKAYFLSIEEIGSGDKKWKKIIFNPSDFKAYSGIYDKSYESNIKIINDFIEYYINFDIKSDVKIINDITNINERFIFARDAMQQLLTITEKDVSTKQHVSKNTADIFTDNQNSFDESFESKILKSTAVFIENYETGYKKIEVIKPDKFAILHHIKSKYEIK